MSADNTPLPEYDRLKELNNQLSDITHQKKACRTRISIFGAIAGGLLAISVIVLINNLLSLNNDWQLNVNSPVHAEASKDQSSKVVMVVSIAGMIIGMGMFVFARNQCHLSDDLNIKERNLIVEMRSLRDKMYIKGQKAPDHRFRPKRDEHTSPLSPKEARGEYVGVYSPPGSDKNA